MPKQGAEPTVAPDHRGDPLAPTMHRTRTPDGAELALTRVGPPDAADARPVVLVHGTYSHRSFWMTDDGFGLAPFLAERGFDVWVPELRGHGRSPKHESFSSWTAEDHIRHDIPTVHGAIVDATGTRPIHVGHSAGGLYLLAALSRGWIDPDEVQALAVFGTQIHHGEAYLNNRLIAGAIKATIRLVGRFPSPALGMGPEPEPPGEMEEIIDWKATGRWTDSQGVSYHDGLTDLALPLRAYAGAGDTTDPPAGCQRLLDAIGSPKKSFQLLSTDTGYSRDYGHAEMIASRAASEEVWPDLADWLAENA